MPPSSPTPGHTSASSGSRIMRRLLELLLHPWEVILLLFRVFHTVKGQGLCGLRQGIRREIHHLTNESLKKPAGYTSYRQWLQDLTPYPTPRPCPHICVTIIIPLDTCPSPGLERTLASIKRQTHQGWEAVLAISHSSTKGIHAYLEQRSDPRISSLKHDLILPALCNEIMSRLNGAYLCLVKAGDELDSQALAKLTNAARHHPEALLVYCDEDRLDNDGSRHGPYFKPDWNPLLCWGQNYLGRLTMFHRDTLKAQGGFNPDLPNTYEWDMVLRLSSGQSDRRILHVPEILYHRNSQDYGDQELISRRQEEKAMLITRLRAAGYDGCELSSVPDGWRVRFPLPDPPPLVSIIIPTRNGYDLLVRCLTSILARTDYPAVEIIVVDNQSNKVQILDYLRTIEESGSARVLRYDAPFNYAAINNMAVGQANGHILCFLNNDTEVIAPNWLTDLVRQAVRPEIGAAGALLYYADGSIQHGGVALGLGPHGPAGIAGHAFQGQKRGYPGQHGRLRFDQNISAVTGACLVVRREVFDEVDGFDAVHLPVTLNDVDLCLKLGRAGYQNVLVPTAELYHHESVSRGLDDDDYGKRLRCSKEMLYMRRTWDTLLQRDPFFPSGELGMRDWV